VPGAGQPLFEAALANANPLTQVRVHTLAPIREPLLIITGADDHIVPPAVVKAAFRKQRRNPGVTELAQFPGRGHSLTLDSGWREVAGTTLAFIARFSG